jgi:hypothetical protein
MTKKDKAIYAPGELDRVRDRLGDFDREEAKQMAQILGGEVGYERTDDEEQAKQNPQRRTRHDRVDVRIGDRPARPKHAVELPLDGEGEETMGKKSSRKKKIDPADDPTVLLKAGYWDRIKMDKFAGQPEFEIKSPGQVLQSMVSIFSDTPDYINPIFVTRRMEEYYKKIETLVVSTRTMFPRNNARRNERMKTGAPVAYSILDVIRYWDIEKISGDLARIQAHPRNARLGDFAEILRVFYRPLYILDLLDLEAHIRGAYKILYKVLNIENHMDAKNKYQELIRLALTAFSGVRRDIHYLLYPMLMKTVSAKFLPYKLFFTERKNRIKDFLNVTENDQINPAVLVMQEDIKDQQEGGESQNKASPESEQKSQEESGEAKKEEISEEERERRNAEEAGKKALERGLRTLEMLFPQAGWNRLPAYPDFYPYFVNVFALKKGIVNIAPTDPMLQIYTLMRTLEELFFGLRYVSFGSVPSSSGSIERVDAILGEIINDWHYYLGTCYEKEYLPRLTEYARILEGSHEERNSMYTKKLVSEMHWIKRLYLLPFYRFDSFMASPLQKKDAIPIYSKIKILRKYLTAVAAGIEQGTRAGGAELHAHCEGIDNPWESYVFQISNPISIRLDALLGPKMKNNASLIYFCLSVATVLDHLVNSEDSWAYSSRSSPLFRSVNGDGITPLTGVDERIDANALFKQALKQRQKNNEK